MSNVIVICNEEHSIAPGKCALCQRDAMRAYVKELREALVWCGGSDDFAPNAKAREGYLKVLALMQPIEAESDA